MNLIERISTALRAAAGKAVRTAAHDLFGEEPATPEDRTARLLSQAEKRLKRLNDLLAEAIGREKRADQDWQEATARANGLDTEVDSAVRGGQDEAARARLEQLRRAQVKAIEAERMYRDYAAATEKLRIEIRDTQAQLDDARKRYQKLAEREGSASASEAAQQARRDQRKDNQHTQAQLDTREEEVAKREDNVAARDDLDQTRIADVLNRRTKKDE